MFYTPGEKLETNVVTNMKAFQLMINFMSELQQRLTAPQHFIQFASEHSTDPARSVIAFRLLARLKKEKGQRDTPYTSVVTPTLVKDSKQMKGNKSKKINFDNPFDVKTGSFCSNCQQVPCSDGHTVIGQRESGDWVPAAHCTGI